jgi:hypothetical protein
MSIAWVRISSSTGSDESRSDASMVAIAPRRTKSAISGDSSWQPITASCRTRSATRS